MLTIDDDDGWLSLGTDADAETSPAGVEDIELERMQATWTKPALPLLPEDLAITFDDEGSHFSNQPPTPNHAALLQSPTLSSPTAAGWLYSGEGALAFVPVPNSPRDADARGPRG